MKLTASATPAHEYQLSTDDGETWSAAATLTAVSVQPGDNQVRRGTFSTTNDDALQVRIVTTVTETLADGTTAQHDEVAPSVAMVDAVHPSFRNFEAFRSDPESGVESLIWEWVWDWNPRTQRRVIITVDIDGIEGGQTLVATSATNREIETIVTSSQINVTNFQPADWPIVGTNQTLRVTQADLRKALKVRVEAGQGASVAAVTAADGWTASNTLSIAAAPGGG